MSRTLYEKALEDTMVVNYVRPIPAFGRRKGETITLTRLGVVAEPSDASLTENVKIPEDTWSLSTIAVTVKEYGRSVPFTSLADDLSEFDIENPVQNALVQQKKLVLDTAAAATFKTAKVCYIPTGVAAGTFDTDGSPSAYATANWSLFHVEEISDYLFDTLRAPAWSGEDYMAIVRTLGLRGIRRDPAWEQWKIYTKPEAKATGEVGRLENIRFTRTNHNLALGKVGTGSVLGEGIVFGRDAVVMAEVLSPELRAAIPADFGRQRSVAWYGILGFGLIWDTANAGEARIVRVTSQA
jgi:N4-gp56 family major capsid protein